MNIRNEHSFTRHFRKIQLIGWITLTLPVIFTLLLPLGFASRFHDLPIGLVFIFLMISAALIALGDALQLRSNRRRVRPIEILQALAPMPVAVAYIFISSDAFGEAGGSFAKESACFVIIMIAVLNMKGVYDRLTMNREIVTCEEMKDLERQSDAAGLSYIEMMERAGMEAFGYICEEEIDLLNRLLIFCGSGNNGGDGFVVARLALDYGCDVTVILPCGLPKTPDAITNYELIRDRIPVIIPEEDDDLAALIDEKLWGDEPSNDDDLVIVDAIFGTGFHGSPEGFPRKAIDYINDHRGINTVYSLDVPSGLPGDLGPTDPNDASTAASDEYDPDGKSALLYSAVYADCVITFHARKPIHINPNPTVSEHIKKTIVADIGITKALENYHLFNAQD